jgi:acetyl-CoA acyltransferase 1
MALSTLGPHPAPTPTPNSQPRTQARRGGLRDTDAVDLLATVYRATLDRTRVEPAALGDVVVGSVLGPSSQRANEARIAMFIAGIPETVPVRTVNRQCSSGLQAVADVAAAIKAGYYSVGLACGVETMSAHPMSWEGGVNPRIADFPQAQGCLMPMGVTSENVAAKFGVDRRAQDAFAAASHRKAAAAQAGGKFKDEIVPVSTKVGRWGRLNYFFVSGDSLASEGSCKFVRVRVRVCVCVCVWVCACACARGHGPVKGRVEGASGRRRTSSR